MIRPEDFTDVIYAVEEDTFAVITINRPERMNAFRGRTVDELLSAFKHAWADRRVAAVILTGAGERAFCAGGDVKERAETGSYGPTEWGMFEIERLHRMIRDIPKPVIAAVNGVAVGGGHVLHVLCDLSIAAEHARFGQSGPRVGSFDAGFGAPYLARVVGEKRARQIWFLLDQYDAATAERWGLVNRVVPAAEQAAAGERRDDDEREPAPASRLRAGEVRDGDRAGEHQRRPEPAEDRRARRLPARPLAEQAALSRDHEGDDVQERGERDVRRVDRRRERQIVDRAAAEGLGGER